MSASRAWRLLVALAPGARILEAAGGGLDRPAELREQGAELTLLRPAGEAAESAREAGFSVVEIGETGAAGPIAAGVHELAVVSPPVGCLGAPELLETAARALRPGGSLVLDAAGPVETSAVLRAVLRRVRGLKAPADEGRPGAAAVPRGRELERRLRDAGFGEARCFAALPDASRPKFLVPLDDPAVVRYFFRQVAPRPRSLLGRAALGLAGPLAERGALSRLAPRAVLAVRAGGNER